MPKYAEGCWETYLAERSAPKLVRCVYEGVIREGGEKGINAKAIKALVKLARQKGQQTYIKLQCVKQEGEFETKGLNGGLYPWLKKYGADILEKEPGRRAFRIRSEFYKDMLSLFAGHAPKSTNDGILRLQGLGKEIWAAIDAQGYVDRERSAWAG